MTNQIDQRRWVRLVIGLCLIGFFMLLMGGMTSSFLRGAVLGTVMSAATLVLLVLITLRYSQDTNLEGEVLQFRISTLMILMALIAAYLGATRELVIHMPDTDGQPEWWRMLVIGFLFGMGMFIAWLCVAESVMTYAARRPWLQRIVRSMFRREASK